MMKNDERTQEPLLTSIYRPDVAPRLNPFNKDGEAGEKRNEEVGLKDTNNKTKDATNKAQDPMTQINDAYKACGFGWFHVKLVVISFFGTVSGVLVTHTTSFLLPVAECDLKMGLIEKGLLNAAPFIGMTITSVIGGFLTDTFGRIKFLRLGYGGMCLFSILGGTSQNFEMLVTAKFFEGMLFSLAISAHVTFLSEFMYKDIRDRVMISQSSFVAISQIISPAMAWAILTQDWNTTIFNGSLILHTWNFYVFIMSGFSLIAFISYCTLPESPKFLVGQGKYDEARDILFKMYKQNTKKPLETYPYIDIWKDVPKPETEAKNSDVKRKTGVSGQMIGGLRKAKPLFGRPLGVYLLILMTSNFVILAVYNVVRLWFPQLSAIVENYGTEENQDLCSLLDMYTADLRSSVNVTKVTPEVCVPKVSGSQTYINSIIVGTVCLFPYFISGALVNKVGKKAIIVTASLICSAVTLAMRWSNSKVTLVSLFAVATALTQLLKAMNQAYAVDVFPTAVRSLGVSLIMFSARIGTLCGNIGFPLLLDLGCVYPFFTMAVMMFFVAALSLTLRKKKS